MDTRKKYGWQQYACAIAANVQNSKIIYLNYIHNGDKNVAHCRYGPCTSVGRKPFGQKSNGQQNGH